VCLRSEYEYEYEDGDEDEDDYEDEDGAEKKRAGRLAHRRVGSASRLV
jgi:hypothetical protein